MHKEAIPLVQLNKGKTGKILYIYGGRHVRHHGRHNGGHYRRHGLHQRLNVLGIREGQIVKVISKQPLMGPITISIRNNQITIGRGIANKIIVEEI